MAFHLDYFLASLVSGLAYLPRTLLLVSLPLALGLLGGLVLAAFRVYRVPVLGRLTALGVSIYQGVPIVVALVIYNLLFMSLFNDVAAFFGVATTVAEVDIIWVGIFALALQEVTLMEEAFRGAFYSVPAGQREAALACGLTELQALRRIIVPQLVPVAVPMLMNHVVGNIKNSSVVIAIGVAEVLTGASIPAARTYSFLESYVAAGLIYWALATAAEQLIGQWEIRPEARQSSWFWQVCARVRRRRTVTVAQQEKRGQVHAELEAYQNIL